MICARKFVHLTAGLMATVALGFCTCSLGATTAKVLVKFDQTGGDNTFAASVYTQEVSTGETHSFPYDPHTPGIFIDLKKPGRYVFYARLVEAPDDYHYGYTSEQAVGYGHMTRGGVGQPEGLIALDIKLGGKYKEIGRAHV